MPDYGRDLACVTGLDPMMRELAGDDPRVVGECVARGQITATGALIDDPTWGLDIFQLENGTFDRRIGLKQWETRLYNQAMRDERVLSCVVSVVFSEATRTVRISTNGETANGPFES